MKLSQFILSRQSATIGIFLVSFWIHSPHQASFAETSRPELTLAHPLRFEKVNVDITIASVIKGSPVLWVEKLESGKYSGMHKKLESCYIERVASLKAGDIWLGEFPSAALKLANARFFQQVGMVYLSSFWIEGDDIYVAEVEFTEEDGEFVVSRAGFDRARLPAEVKEFFSSLNHADSGSQSQ